MGLAEEKNQAEHNQLVHVFGLQPGYTVLLIGWLTSWLDCYGCTVRL